MAGAVVKTVFDAPLTSAQQALILQKVVELFYPEAGTGSNSVRYIDDAEGDRNYEFRYSIAVERSIPRISLSEQLRVLDAYILTIVPNSPRNANIELFSRAPTTSTPTTDGQTYAPTTDTEAPTNSPTKTPTVYVDETSDGWILQYYIILKFVEEYFAFWY